MRMAKPVLGRDLSTLMGEKREEKSAGPSVAPLGGAGVDSLLRGQRPAGTPAPLQQKPFPRGYLFAGDILLVILALIIIYKSPRPVSWKTEAFCGAVVALGTVLALLAAWLGEEPPSEPGQLSNKSRAGAGVIPNTQPPHQFRDEKAKPAHPQQ
jgi:hypothetical protein